MSVINRLVSIKNPVLNALQDMGIDIAADVPVFTRWAADAEKNGIGSHYSYTKQIEVLTIENCTVELPVNATYVQYVVLGDYGCECVDLFDVINRSIPSLTGFNTDNTFLIVDANGDQSCSQSSIKWTVQNGKLIFRKDYKGEKITVQYLGLERDQQGFPMVMENHVEAIVEYIMYKYCVRSKFSPLKMTDSDRAWHYKQWNILASEARATDSIISDSDRQEIIAMIHNPYIGYGADVALRNTGW